MLPAASTARTTGRASALRFCGTANSASADVGIGEVAAHGREVVVDRPSTPASTASGLTRNSTSDDAAEPHVVLRGEQIDARRHGVDRDVARRHALALAAEQMPGAACRPTTSSCAGPCGDAGRGEIGVRRATRRSLTRGPSAGISSVNSGYVCPPARSRTSIERSPGAPCGADDDVPDARCDRPTSLRVLELDARRTGFELEPPDGRADQRHQRHERPPDEPLHRRPPRQRMRPTRSRCLPASQAASRRARTLPWPAHSFKQRRPWPPRTSLLPRAALGVLLPGLGAVSTTFDRRRRADPQGTRRSRSARSRSSARSGSASAPTTARR